eukprot:TRINITY_DN6300_c0_g1_i7.p1 TRINITY_DN6300_c0_g1~~TRINITY_DN6300_c0_g1_i7.p1  ORF type:complete len:560 (-),score=84.77 TRINITY_DN6300_c0_g1_i7:511-2190(-)
MKACSESNFNCTIPCGNPYSCGHHSCEKICHSGPCGSCPREGPRSCYCGKKVIIRPCWQDVHESCVNTCEKVLACGIHRCFDKCHKGNCPPCREYVQKSCRCGRMARSRVQCSQLEVRCSVKCGTVLNCRKHFCPKKCCTGKCADCDKPCNALLSCGNHRCKAKCHPHPCLECPIEMQLRCSCGDVTRIVPCGKKFVLPHSNLLSCLGGHKSESLPCTKSWFSCSSKCGNVLSCGNHFCEKSCHTITRKREIQLVTKEVDDEDEAYDDVVMDEEGNVTKVKNIFQVSLIFVAPSPEDDDPFVNKIQLENDEEDTCDVCTLSCTKPRDCQHPCKLPCHLNLCPPCIIPIRVDCYCKSVRLHIPCWKYNIPDLRRKLKSCGGLCGRILKFCEHICELVCHEGDCPSNTCMKKVTVRCACNNLKQQWTCDKVREFQTTNQKSNLKSFALLPCNEVCESKKKKSTDLSKEMPPKQVQQKQPQQVQTRPKPTSKGEVDPKISEISRDPKISEISRKETKVKEVLQRRLQQEKTNWSPRDIFHTSCAIGLVMLFFWVTYLKVTEY